MPGEAPIDERAGAGPRATSETGSPVGPRVALRTAPAHEEMPRIHVTRRQLLLFALFVVACLAFLYFVLPKVLGLKHTWYRIQDGDLWWLGLAAFLELCSFLGYIVLFRGVFVRGRSRIGLRVSYQITMAGLAATRLFASGGAGGIVLTAWALRRSGMPPRTVAQRMVAFNVLLYAVFMLTLVLGGIGLYVGVLPGVAPFAITVLPAVIAAAIIALFLGVSLVPGDFDRLVARWTTGGPLGRLAERVATVPAAAASGIRTAESLIRTRDPQLLGAIAWWYFDITVLWAAFHAFGAAPSFPVVVMCYFIGQLGNLLPLPGGIGGVDGAMIGAFSAFDVSGSLAVVSVLAYRAFAFWLPTLPGAVAYLQLRRPFTIGRMRNRPPILNEVTFTDQTIEKAIIVGSGPAGYTAALYMARADLEPFVVEGFAWGGLLQQTTDVENFPGFPAGIMGPELMQQMRDQAERFGARLETDDVTAVELSPDGSEPHKVWLGDELHLSRTIVLAMGAEHRKLGVAGEQELSGRGVSYCATCDAAFFKQAPTMIIGGGDSAMEEAIFLAKFASTVVVVNRRDEFRASQIMLARAREVPNIELLTPYVVEEFASEGKSLEIARLRNTVDGSTKEIEITGAFIAVGHDPQSEIVKGQVELDDEGYVVTQGRSTLTNVPGVFAAGDLVDHTYRQAITAAGSGCQAALDAEWYLRDTAFPFDSALRAAEA